MTDAADPDRSPSGPNALDEVRDLLADADRRLREPTIESNVVHRGHYMNFRVDRVRQENGRTPERDIVDHPGAVATLALDDRDRILFVAQFRPPADRVLLEIPAGTLKRENGGTEDPDLAAARELEEETGYRARKMEKLAAFWTAPGFATEHMTLYLATGLEPATGERLQPDEDEKLELIRLTLPDALAAIDAGIIADAKSILGILMLARRTG